MKRWIVWMLAALMCLSSGAQAEESCSACKKGTITESCMAIRMDADDEVMTWRNDFLTCHYVACTYQTQALCDRCGSKWIREKHTHFEVCNEAGELLAGKEREVSCAAGLWTVTEEGYILLDRKPVTTIRKASRIKPPVETRLAASGHRLYLFVEHPVNRRVYAIGTDVQVAMRSALPEDLYVYQLAAWEETLYVLGIRHDVHVDSGWTYRLYAGSMAEDEMTMQPVEISGFVNENIWTMTQRDNMLYTCDASGAQCAIDLDTGLAEDMGRYLDGPAVMGEKP